MPQFLDLMPIMPEILLTTLALLLLLADAILKKRGAGAIGGLSIFGLLSTIIGVYYLYDNKMPVIFSGMFSADNFSLFFKFIFLISAILTILISFKYIKVRDINIGEYYILILFATIGMMIMASGTDLISIYVSLELMAMSTYILAGIERQRATSNESAMKYFILGAFSSALLLYGISFVYGITGTTNLEKVAAYLSNTPENNMAVVLSLILLVSAFAFKIAAVPFHMWTPDVYQGAPTPITGFMSAGSKAAGFAVLLRFLFTGMPSLQNEWITIIIVLSILTMTVGNIAAIVQTNIKRMLAFSSIAHAGYLLIAVVTVSDIGLSSILLYLLIYAFMNMGAFGVVSMVQKKTGEGGQIDDYKGLAKVYPFGAFMMLLFLFSLTGIPPTAGFIGKFYIFAAAVKKDLIELAVIGVINSAISAYYYLRVIMYMYMKEPEEDVVLEKSAAMTAALVISAVFVLSFIIYSEPVVNNITKAVSGLIR
ncbi:MAG: NADH-quinone oxidoreductase subunit N [Nitrospirae bacterium]|nr:NADH-quinone oxidoreductase subunit N [Nitrospirota bacterium]